MRLKYLCLLLLALPGLLLATDAIGNGTVAGLPAFGLNTNSITAITDGADTSDCTVGLGSTYVVCLDTGAAWVKAFPGGDYVDIDPGPAPDYLEGRLFYDEDADALSYYTNNENVTLQIGQETWVQIKNETGAQINDGQAVYIDGAVGASGVPTVDLAQADAEATVKQVGVATHNIGIGEFGFVTVTGIVRGVDTENLGEGALLYVSHDTPGLLVNTPPAYPNWVAPVAYVINDHVQNGSIFVFRETATRQDHAAGAGAPVGVCAVTGDTYTDTTNHRLYACHGDGDDWTALQAHTRLDWGLCGAANCSVSMDVAYSYIVTVAQSVDKCYAYAKTGPTGADMLVDLLKNGTDSIFTTRLTIAADANAGTSTAFNAFAADLAEGDFLELVIDQVGSTLPGRYLSVTCIFD
jgi:hypothetical protein